MLKLYHVGFRKWENNQFKKRTHGNSQLLMQYNMATYTWHYSEHIKDLTRQTESHSWTFFYISKIWNIETSSVLFVW